MLNCATLLLTQKINSVRLLEEKRNTLSKDSRTLEPSLRDGSARDA